MFAWQIWLLKLSRRGRGSCFTFFSVLAAQQQSHFILLKRGHKIKDAVMWRQNLWTAQIEQRDGGGRHWHSPRTFGNGERAKTAWTNTYTGLNWTHRDCPFPPVAVIWCSSTIPTRHWSSLYVALRCRPAISTQLAADWVKPCQLWTI